MTREEWAEVDRLYHAALDRHPSERAAFLCDACGRNDALRREVDSLLNYEPKAKGFLEAPAAVDAVAAAPLASAVRQAQEPFVPGGLVGRTFGFYELTALIAAGGMGEVYRARDTRLGRTVAVKILPEHLTDDAERRERFQREARIVSSLSHPHVCALYDVGIHEGRDYLVMEHLDGETLQDRLNRERMHWVEAVKYLLQLAEALDAAHRQGIVHRDLKPANVMLTKSGVKVLDFGLAARRVTAAALLDPSLNTRKLTIEGRIMGTVPYMAPEQLQGKEADARADIFALGALAYEMLTGKPPFNADSQAALIGAILKDDPEPIATSAPDVPPLLVRTVDRCLSKDPEHRWQTAADLSFQLRLTEESAGAASVSATPRHRSRRGRVLTTAAVAVSLSAAGALWLQRDGTAPMDPAAVTGVTRFPLFPPDGTTFPSSFDVPFALAPSGRQIVYAAAEADGTTRLWLRALDSEQHQLLAGTEGATAPFWSPDSEWIGFFAGGSLKKVRVSSPIVQVIASPVWTMGGAAWSRNDVIVFPGPGGLLRVSSGGGAVSRVARDRNFHLWPQFLDDGEHYIYASYTPRNLLLGSLANEPPRTLMTFPVNVSAAAYVRGFIFYVQDGVLFARPFDERRREFTGPPSRVLRGIPVTGPGRAPFSVSAAGVIAFWSEPVGTPALLRWFARNGVASPPIAAPARYFGFALSPDDRELAFARVGKTGGPDLWVRNLENRAETQLTFDGLAFTPHWSPDGSRILFTGLADRPPPMLFVKQVRRPDAPVSLGHASGPQFASGWAGSFVLSTSVGMGGPNGSDLWMQRIDSGKRERVPVDTEFNESEGRLSPNAEWIVYTTDQTGQDEVWIASFPWGTLRRQVSVGGGRSPQFCDGQRQIVYLAPDNHVMSVPFEGSAARVDVGEARPLFAVDELIRFDRALVPTANSYAAAADCRRFLVATRPPAPQSATISIVVNWPDLLRR